MVRRDEHEKRTTERKRRREERRETEYILSSYFSCTSPLSVSLFTNSSLQDRENKELDTQCAALEKTLITPPNESGGGGPRTVLEQLKPKRNLLLTLKFLVLARKNKQKQNKQTYSISYSYSLFLSLETVVGRCAERDYRVLC